MPSFYTSFARALLISMTACFETPYSDCPVYPLTLITGDILIMD
ncbi:MAG: hypothetical protein PHT33_13255 [bacterium]|nr:hypothetical protein [bacterium]